MIRRSRPPHFPTPLVAWLALALIAASRVRAADEPQAATPPPPAPAPAVVEATAAATTEAVSATPAAASKPTAPKRATTETQGLLNLGASLADRGDFEASEIAYRQVLNTPVLAEHDLKSALLGLAHMHRQQGALTKAAAIYERFLKDYPGDDRTPDALLDLGRTLRGLGVYKLAVARFYNVINSTLKLPGEGFERYQVLAKTAQFEIAETHFQAGEFAEANKYYMRLRLLDLAPADRARAHFKAGYALKLHGDLEGAITSLRAYMAQWPDDENVPEARHLLAITLREMKRPQEAFAATLELLRAEKSRIASDPKRWAYWQRRTGNQLANDFFETGDTLNARAIYAGLLELSPEPAWRLPITYQLALCYERLGITDRARTAYQAIVDAAGPKPAPDFLELATMSRWRIEHLEWRERVGHQVSTMFESTTGKQATIAVPATAPFKAASTP
jgi:tetratricopeptide (TPR) repeat protein